MTEGNAYGFFHCNASRQQIEAELATIREDARTPSELELTLTEGMENVRGDEKLLAIAELSKNAGLNYMFHARLPNATNRTAADETADILNNTYNSPLYERDAPFQGEVVYKEKGEYVRKEE